MTPQNYLQNSWKCSTENAVTAMFKCFSSRLQMGREAVGQQNAECVKYLTDFRKWFHLHV